MPLDLSVLQASRWLRPARLSGAVLVVGLAAGCKNDRPRTYAVAGRVTVGGAPAAGAEVTLHPAGAEWAERLPHRPFGKVESDGQVRFSSFHADDGVPAGKYVVTVRWPAADGETDRLADAHASPQRPNPLTVEVADAGAELPPIDLPAPAPARRR